MKAILSDLQSIVNQKRILKTKLPNLLKITQISAFVKIQRSIMWPHDLKIGPQIFFELPLVKKKIKKKHSPPKKYPISFLCVSLSPNASGSRSELVVLYE
jgi:hypothetical protein